MNGILYYNSKILNSYKPVLSLKQNIPLLNFILVQVACFYEIRFTYEFDLTKLYFRMKIYISFQNEHTLGPGDKGTFAKNRFDRIKL